jgi:hypothetical protein
VLCFSPGSFNLNTTSSSYLKLSHASLFKPKSFDGYIVGYAKTNECYNERILQRTNVTTNECYNKRMLQRSLLQRKNITTNEFYKKRRLQRTHSTTNECHNERYYNKRILQRTNATTNEFYNERMLQRRVFANKNRMLKRKQSNLDSLFKKVDKRPPKDGLPTGHSPKVSRNDDSSPSTFV